jgi:hypothetical protein
MVQRLQLFRVIPTTKPWLPELRNYGCISGSWSASASSYGG